MKLKGKLTAIGTLTGSLTSQGCLHGVITGGISRLEPLPYYEGAYEITPTTEAVTLNTANKSMAQNIVVNPIPQNYGLITYNGGYITVS